MLPAPRRSNHAAEPIQISRPLTRPSIPQPGVSRNDCTGSALAPRSGLPAGAYLIAAVAEEASVNWQNPKTLQALARLASTVTMVDGESRQLALRTMAMVPR